MSILGSVLKEVISSFGKKAPVINQGNDDFPGIRRAEGGRIIGFYGHSAGDAIRELTHIVLSPLEKRSSGISLINLNSPQWLDELKEVLCEPVWFAASFFSVGQLINVLRDHREVNLWEYYGVPFVRFYGDIPAYFPDRHLIQYRNSVNIYFDPAHAWCYQRWIGKGLTGIVPPMAIKGSGANFEEKLNGEVVFAKNGNSPAALRNFWKNSLPESVSRMLLNLGEELSTVEALNSTPSLDKSVSAYWEGLGFNCQSSPSLLLFFVAQLDDYLRRIKSTLITEAILDLPVVVSGDFWGHVDFRGHKARLDSSNNFKKTQDMFSHMLAMIDMSPNTDWLVHDRVCRAVGSETAFVTNSHSKLRVAGLDGSRYLFNFDKDSVREVVDGIIRNPRETIELGREQARVFNEIFNEENYAMALLAAIDVMNLKLGGRPFNTQNFVSFPSGYIE